jgi:uncharacterized protein YukE
MRIRALAAAVLASTAVVTASTAQADPRGEVQQLQQQTSELHASWDGLSPAQRQQRLNQLSQQATIVQNDVHALPPEQQPEVQLMLGQVTIELADLLRKVWPVP